MPEAARERLAKPPAGTALAPMARHASGPRPLRERDSTAHVTKLATDVKGTVS